MEALKWSGVFHLYLLTYNQHVHTSDRIIYVQICFCISLHKLRITIMNVMNSFKVI